MNARLLASRLGILTAALTLGCIAPVDTDEPPPSDLTSDAREDGLAGGLTSDFRSWLSANGYEADDFTRDDLQGGSFGGKTSPDDPIVNQPVIFIHGNSDKALGTVTGQTGWTASVEYFQSKGYTSAELYATTWGPANPLYSSQQYHSKEHVMRIRRFIEAVLLYTGASKVDIIAHSMGVTLGRKAVKGGTASDLLAGGKYTVGPSLTSYVDTFVGIAGANLGLTSCYFTGPTTPTCGSTNGLYPGYWNGFWVSGRSAYLNDLLSSSGYEGSYRYSIFSTVDEVVGAGGLVYGEYTSRIPGETGEVKFTEAPYGHFGSKDLTQYNQWRMVKDHATD